MHKNSQPVQTVVEGERPRSLEVTSRGIANTGDIISLMANLMDDVLAGRATPKVANVIIGATSQVLKAADMQHRYGMPNTATGVKQLQFNGAQPETRDAPARADRARTPRVPQLT